MVMALVEVLVRVLYRMKGMEVWMGRDGRPGGRGEVRLSPAASSPLHTNAEPPTHLQRPHHS